MLILSFKISFLYPVCIAIIYLIYKSKNFLTNNDKEFVRFLKTQQLIRDVDEIHVIDENKKLITSTLDNRNNYIVAWSRILYTQDDIQIVKNFLKNTDFYLDNFILFSVRFRSLLIFSWCLITIIASKYIKKIPIKLSPCTIK